MKRTITLASIMLTLTVASLGTAGIASSATSSVLDVPVRTGAADAEESPTKISLTGGDLNLGADGSTAQTVGLRFTGVSIPAGVTITKASIQFQADEVTTGNANLTIGGEAADNAAAFTTGSKNISSRPRTTAKVTWAPAPWSTAGARGAEQRTPDLSPVVQQIVSRPGWASGNALAVVVAGTGTRTAESYEGGAAKAPALHIEYSSGTAATSPASTPPPTSGSTPSMGSCEASGRDVVRPYPAGTTLKEQWEAKAPADDVTYDLSGVSSTAYPATKSMFAVGTGDAALNTCVVGGTIRGQADDDQTWQYYHDEFNAACVKIIARDSMQVRDVRCDNVEDGIKPQESAVNANNATFHVEGTYLSRIRDDCMENDYTVGGVLRDNLWEQCNTGISERPSSDRSWSTPASETLTLDHMLIGLYETPHVEDGTTVMGENTLFKWSTSGNRVVIKCSTFKVDSVSLNGKSSMALPPGTVVDDSACPNNPSTIVWLGGGDYPVPTAGMRVVSDASVWTNAVRTWKSAHGY
jgi:hypothetical protein